MQIVIPMSGFGERFRQAEYTVPKPLIEIDGKPIIAHVIDMFPGASRFVFICNREHLETLEFRMRETLQAYCPTGEIVGIEPHKLGPIHAVSQVYDRIADDEPVVVNYCDFTCYWDFSHFCRFVEESGCDGAIPCYRGFHPHSLGSTFYAYVRDRDGWGIDIQEKQPFTDLPINEYASSGTYYFASGRLMRAAFERAVKDQLTVGGEYYVSLAYKPMMAEGRHIAVYELQHFMQWGTPQDLEEYRNWSDAFRHLLTRRVEDVPPQKGSVLVPMAGLGSRFTKEGYQTPKPLIEVSGKPMIVQATADLPCAEQHVFVVRQDMQGMAETQAELQHHFAAPRLVTLQELTDGQARTCLMGLDAVDREQPLTIGACDNGALYDGDRFAALMADPKVDVIVWAVRSYPGAVRRPQMFGWVDCDGDRVRGVSVKVPLAQPETDPIILGSFTFKRARDFETAANRMIERDARVNGEFYVDTCINDALALGLDCRVFEVDSYLCWGTPDDLRTFEYWQSCFHKWPTHPYSLQEDSRVDPASVPSLEQRYAARLPTLPGQVP